MNTDESGDDSTWLATHNRIWLDGQLQALAALVGPNVVIVLPGFGLGRFLAAAENKKSADA